VPLRVAVNVQQNSVTVIAEKGIVAQVEQLIRDDWDLPLSKNATKIYDLRWTDPIKVRDTLQELLGGGTGARPGGAARTGAAAGAQRAAGGGESSVGEIVGGIFNIQAYPDSNRLIVISKTEDSFPFLDSIVDALDQPLDPGIPILVELKHADAEELADQLNALLSEAGSNATIERAGRGLTVEGGLGESPFSGADGDTTGGAGGAQGQANQINFPWQRGRPRDDQAPESALIGKIRIVPISRQNALAILAPPEIRDAVRNLIEQGFDKPGRQVMIVAIIAEVALNDQLALGIRISNSGEILSGALIDNRIGATSSIEASKDDVLTWFTTSVLDLNVSVNAVIQALHQLTNVRILQQPRVFTADNREAVFFDGQDFPFIEGTQTTDVGTVNETTEYRPVGLKLAARPRITAQRDVNMSVSLVLSSIVQGQTVAGNFIVDRREVNTEAIIKNGQTIVISGIRTEQESEIKRKIPLLGDIPLVGELFTSRDRENSATELLAFITPIVVDNPMQNDTNFNVRDRKLLEELSQPLKDATRDMARRQRLLPRDMERDARGGDEAGEPLPGDVEPPSPGATPDDGDTAPEDGDLLDIDDLEEE
jgi:general secretion pathway protein D